MKKIFFSNMKPPNFVYTTNSEIKNVAPNFVYTTKPETNSGNFPVKLWSDRGIYWEHAASQGSDAWKLSRIGRINSSNSGSMAGKSNFKTPEETGRIISGLEEEVFSDKNIEAMDHGHRYEKIARNWFENAYNCRVLERGLCVPKWDIEIGASIDGEVIGKNEIIEFKCPQSMYRPILTYIENIQHGWRPEKSVYTDHIWETHLAQMMHGMAVTGKSFCHYVVYCVSTSQVYTQKIPFDPEYWRLHYNIIKNNYNLYIRPHLKSGFPLSPLSPFSPIPSLPSFSF